MDAEPALGAPQGRRPLLVLVAGVARSGSTALDRMLANRPDAASVGEVYAWYRPYRSHHRAPRCGCGVELERCPMWSQVGRPRARHLHRRVVDALGVDVVVDSSKSLGWIRDATRWARRDGLDVMVVMPWRGCGPLAHSYWKRGHDDWLRNLEGYLRRLGDLGLSWGAVDLDALVHDPGRTLDELYARVGRRYRPGQERFWEGSAHSLFGSEGTQRQIEAGRSSLRHTELPPAFERYWRELPPDVRRRADAVDASVRRGGSACHVPSWRPPPWYVKQRALDLRNRAVLAVRPDARLR